MSKFPPTSPMNFNSTYFRVFSFPEVIRDLMTGFEGERWVNRIDFDSLSREDPPNEAPWDGRADAVIWRVERTDVKARSVVLVFLFQPEVDQGMALDVAARCVLLYGQDPLVDAAERPVMSPVIPYVLYNGCTRWTAKTDIKDLIAYGPPEMNRYRPRFSHNVIEEQFCPLLDNAVDNIAGMLFRAQRSRSVRSLLAAIEDSNQRLRGNPELKRAIVAWIKDVVLTVRVPTVDFSSVSELSELKDALEGDVTARVKTTATAGFGQAQRVGRADGLRWVVKQLVRMRYGEEVEAELAELTGSLESGDALREIAEWVRKSKTAEELLRRARKLWQPTLGADAVPSMDVH